MSTEENKAIVRRFLEGIFTQGNPDVVDELAGPNFVVHDPSSEGGDVDAEGVKGSIAWSHSAFPDLRVTIEDQVAEGSKVATRWRVRGTHRGEMMGAVPTGNQVTFTGTQTDYISGGKIVESWSNWDTLGMLHQIGAVPVPERAADRGLTRQRDGSLLRSRSL
jgi:predicted ester cyclase